MKLRILYHGNCFDGVSSAAIFTKFYRAKIHADAAIGYTPVMHKAGNAFDTDQFDGDENVIVDFKYSADDRLTWWFDHHQSAFLSDADEQHFLTENFSISRAPPAPNLSPASQMRSSVSKIRRLPN